MSPSCLMGFSMRCAMLREAMAWCIVSSWNEGAALALSKGAVPWNVSSYCERRPIEFAEQQLSARHW